MNKTIRSLALVLLVLALPACSSRPPLEDVQAEAEISCDRTALEKRARMDRKMGRIRDEAACDDGYIMVCQKQGAQEVCGCVSPLDSGLRR